MTTAGAYLRKSKDAVTKANHISMLMASIHAHGHNGDTVVYDDWARSGDLDKIAKRTAWRDLCDAIERGEHDVVFMNSLDRGDRSIEEWLRFVRLARSRGVRVIADGVDHSAAENRDRLIFESWAAEKELARSMSVAGQRATKGVTSSAERSTSLAMVRSRLHPGSITLPGTSASKSAWSASGASTSAISASSNP